MIKRRSLLRGYMNRQIQKRIQLAIDAGPQR